MEYVEPIKDIESIIAMKLILKKQSQRDLLLFVLGINTGVRISDLLSLKVDDVWDGVKSREFLHLKDDIREETQTFFLNNSVRTELQAYMEMHSLQSMDYLFKSKQNNKPISRQQAYRIINHAAKEVGITGKIGTHTLRKTFGYHAYRKGIAISILMKIFHHHSSGETLRYLGISKLEENLVKVDVNL
jgi:integrase